MITTPITQELEHFRQLFDESLSHSDGLLHSTLEHIRSRGGKRMRPILVLLLTKAFNGDFSIARYGAVALELLHTASLVHDDVVDQSEERRGQASVNASYNNKIAVLVGDYILSTALRSISFTKSEIIVRELAELGQRLSNGELLQLSNITADTISEDAYYRIIREKTASLFETCAVIAAFAGDKNVDIVEKARDFGRDIGLIFQIKDDILDYYPNSEIGKPTGHDMEEGKLTLPAIWVVNQSKDEEIKTLAYKIKACNATKDEIQRLVDYTLANGGIEYAESIMQDCRNHAFYFIDTNIENPQISTSLKAYIDFIIDRRH